MIPLLLLFLYLSRPPKQSFEGGYVFGSVDFLGHWDNSERVLVEFWGRFGYVPTMK